MAFWIIGLLNIAIPVSGMIWEQLYIDTSQISCQRGPVSLLGCDHCQAADPKPFGHTRLTPPAARFSKVGKRDGGR